MELGQTVSKWLTILAGVLSFSTTGFGSYWGNLFTYFASYLDKYSEDHSERAAPWILPLWFVGLTIVSFFAGQLAMIIGKRATLFCGIVLQNLGVLMVYFTIGKSMVITNICLGFIHGIGAGCVQITLIHLVLEWGENSPGFLVALIRGCTAIGGALINHFVTVYINPDNLTPDTKIGSPNQRVFSQNSVLEKVPKIFLVLGGIFFGVEFLCLLLVREKPRNSLAAEVESLSVSAESLSTAVESNRICYHSIESDSVHLVESARVESVPQHSKDNLKNDQEKSDATPRQLIRRKEFYVFSLTMACACVPFLNTDNYYKAYGQIYIHDDLFLTSVGDVLLVLVFPVGLLWGGLLDKFGSKAGLVAYLTCVPLSNIFFYFSPMLGKWAYSVAALFLVSFSSQLNLIYSICVAKTFGKTNFTSNFGMVTFPCVLVYLLTPLLLQVVLEYAGWFYIFFISALLTTGALLAAACVLD